MDRYPALPESYYWYVYNSPLIGPAITIKIKRKWWFDGKISKSSYAAFYLDQADDNYEEALRLASISVLSRWNKSKNGEAQIKRIKWGRQ